MQSNTVFFTSLSFANIQKNNQMQPPNIKKEIDALTKEAERWARNDLPRQVGREAVTHFKANFNREGFVDDGLQKWQEVKRRDPGSPWYGFEYKGERRTSYAFSRDRKTGKTRKAKQQKRLNFSRAATQRKILNGRIHELQDSLRYVKNDKGVMITSDKPYAAVHNEGGPIKVFGKKTVRLPARPFVGYSQELDEKIEQIINKGLDNLFKR